MNIAESERERTGIKSSFTMTANGEREVIGGAQMLVFAAPPPHGRKGRTFSRKLEGLTDFIDQMRIPR